MSGIGGTTTRRTSSAKVVAEVVGLEVNSGGCGRSRGGGALTTSVALLYNL